MFANEITSEWMILAGSAILTLFFSFFPGVNIKYALLSEVKKKLIMAGLIFLIVAVVFALTCFSVIESSLVCTKQGAYSVIGIYLLAIGVNQGLFNITPQTNAVRAIKLRVRTEKEQQLMKLTLPAGMKEGIKTDPK